MKKKIFSSLLLVAAIVATSSVVFSCKDYDDEYAIEQRKMLDDLATLQDKIVVINNYLTILKGKALWTRVDSQAIWDYYVAVKNLTDTKLDSVHAFEVFLQESDLADYLKQGDLAGYTKEDTLAYYATLDSLNNRFAELVSGLDTSYVQATTFGDFKAEFEQSKEDYNNAIDSLGQVIDSISMSVSTSITNIVTADLDSIKAVTKELGESLVRLDSAVLATATKAENALNRANDAFAKADSALTLAKSNKDAIGKNAEDIAANKQLIEALTTIVNAKVDSAEFNSLKTTVANLEGTVSTLSTDLQNAIKDIATAQSAAEAAQATADANKLVIDSLKTAIQDFVTETKLNETLLNYATKQELNELATLVAANDSTIKDIVENQLPALDTKIANAEKAAKAYADSLASEIGKQLAAKADTATVNQLTITVGELRNYVNEAIPALQTLTDSLKTALGELTPRVDALENSMKSLQDEVKKLVSKEDFNKFVSSVNINGTENPVIGYFNLPLDVRSMLLATYFGNADLVSDSRKFPTIRTNNAVFANRQFNDADDEMIGIEGASYQITINNKELLFNEEAGNAGKVYLTINPNTVDFTGLDGVSLVNSQNQQAPFLLENVKKSNEVLSYGYKMTRASNSNNFYEAQATLPKNKVSQATIKVDIQNYKAIAQDIMAFVKDRSNRPDVANIARTVYTQVSNVLPEQFVQVSWTDSQASRFVRSGSGLAATAVRPLSYSFFKDADYKTVPGYERAISFIDEVIGKIKIDIPEINVDPMVAPQVQEIKMIELSDDMIAKFYIKLDTVLFEGGEKVPFTVEMGTFDVTDEDGNVVGTAVVGDKDGYAIVPQQTLTIHFDLRDEIQKLYSDLQQPVADTRDAIQKMVNDLIDDVNEIIKQVNQLDNVRVSIEQAKKDIRDQLVSYLTKLNDLIVKGVNNANNALQPFMLVKTSNGFVMGMTTPKKATKVKSGAVLVLTSYTGEIVAPAYKKFVAVTNVFKNDGTLKTSAKRGDATCKSLLKQANTGNLLKVLPGSTQAVEFNGKAGYIYEIAYAALDYSGRDTVRKFYVEVH